MLQPLLNKKTYRAFFWAVIALALLISVTQISATPPNATVTNLIISEFMATNGAGLTDEDGDYVDWIEVYNQSRLPLNLGGWALTNDPAQPAKWMFPDITLGGRDYLVVFASGKNRLAAEPGTALHTNFKLNKQGDFLAIYNVLEARFMDEISPAYPQQFRDVSYGRYGESLRYGYLAIATPGGPNDDTLAWTDVTAPVAFSVDRGFYDAPFTVALDTPTPDATIRYTTDGSEPTETNGAVYTAPIPIETTTAVQAVAFKTGFLPSQPATHTYIFIADVLTQPARPQGFPASWGTRLADSEGRIEVLPVEADYEMEATVVDQNALPEALQSIPTLSLVMDRQSFADLHTHVEDTQARERPVSVEWIEPGSEGRGFHINAGVRPYVVSAAAETSPKRSFRLLFKGVYGATTLEYPLFPDSPVTEFDTLALLAGRDDAFAGAPTGDVTYTRNAWLRASQVAMSGLGSHGIFAHLYINGLYWGLYNVAERPDDAFMAAYLGGDKDDWFIANQDGPLSRDLDERAETLNYLFTILDFAAQTGTDPEQAAYLAEPTTELVSFLDPAQFSDYMILNWYAGVENWPEQRWYAGIRLQDIAGRGRYFVWDSDEIFREKGAKIGFGDDDTPQTGITAPLFETLIQDPDFKSRLADRMYKHLFNDGALTDAKAQARWAAINETIERAMTGELARWGDMEGGASLTGADWRAANEAVLAQMDGNAARLITLAREAGYYPPIDPPLFSRSGGLVEAGFTLEMALPPACEDCTIYYSVNGADPRLPVTGDLLATATAYDQPIVLTTTAGVKARVLQGDASGPAEELVWSALHEATFNVLSQDNGLRLTEIMYNPLGGDNYEFIELKNTGDGPLNLAGMFIDGGIRFLFPPDAPPLAPGDFVILVSHPETFAGFYPDVEIDGVYEGHLSNKGEKIILHTANAEPFLTVEYNDANGWPVSADGRGDSITLVHPDGDPNDPRSWQASPQLYGSPGGD